MEPKGYFSGQRVILDGIHLGTVRFFGKVDGEPNAPGQNWVGIEWDDPSRGKHSGQFKDGPVLFQTRIPNSATFMKPSTRLGIGRSFLTALKEKYLDENLLNPTEGLQSAEPEDRNMRKVALRFSQLDRLRLIGLESSRISGSGTQMELDELDGLLLSVETLNLSSNMFSDMHDVSVIAGKLPQLKTLVLSSNRFQHIPRTLPGLRKIEALYLDSTLLTWKQSIEIACQIEALCELALSNCRIGHIGIQSLAIHVTSVESLSILTLDQNGLANWQELISSLRIFPRLKQLNLRRNKFRITPKNEEISPKDGESPIYRSLRSISLVGNLVQLGDEIDHLHDWLPSLSCLFLDGNPLYDSQDIRKCRLLAIGRYPTLTHLDGSQITSAEKVEADLFYWSTIAKEGTDPNQLTKSHRRYQELLEKFGPPDIAPTNLRSKSLKAKMIDLTIIWPDHIKIETPNIQVLPSMTVRGLRIYLAKMIRRSSPEYVQSINELADNLDLFIVNEHNNPNQSIDFVNHQKTLEWYGVADGDTLQVQLKN